MLNDVRIRCQITGPYGKAGSPTWGDHTKTFDNFRHFVNEIMTDPRWRAERVDTSKPTAELLRFVRLEPGDAVSRIVFSVVEPEKPPAEKTLAEVQAEVQAAEARIKTLEDVVASLVRTVTFPVTPMTSDQAGRLFSRLNRTDPAG